MDKYPTNELSGEISPDESEALMNMGMSLFTSRFVEQEQKPTIDEDSNDLPSRTFFLDSEDIPVDSILHRFDIEAVYATYDPHHIDETGTIVPELVTLYGQQIGEDPREDPGKVFCISRTPDDAVHIGITYTTGEGELLEPIPEHALELRSLLHAIHELI